MPDIDFQKIVLNLIPKKGDEPVIFYASQYETTRPFIADLFWGDTEFEPGDDCWAEIDIRKNDDNLVVITDDVSIDNNEVSVILPVQAVTCIGKNLGQIKIYAGEDQLVAALNFILEVQPDPLAGGVTSDTAIDNLTEQIAEIVPEVIGDDYYNKTETDALLADKADVSDLPDMTNYYTKTQTDTLLNGKADASTTYTKTEVDNALALKANTADLATVATTGDYDDLINKPVIPAAQVQSDYAQADNTQVDYIKNKPDINAMIAAAIDDILPVGSAGPSAIATFDTALSRDLVDCKSTIVATGGNGTTSTPIPINGYTSMTITVADSSMVTQETYTVSWQNEAGTVYGGVLDVTRGKLRVTYLDIDMGSATWYIRSGTTDTFYTLPTGAKELFNGTCSCYQGTSESASLLGDKEWTSLGGGNMAFWFRDTDFDNYTGAQVASALTGQRFIYELATPFDIDLTPVQIEALLGVNNVFSDTNGTTEVKYKDTIQHYIDNQ